MLRNKLNVMMEGWVDTILQYDFDTQYLPGERNTLADALSQTNDEEHSYCCQAMSQFNLNCHTSTLELSMEMEAERRGKHIPSTMNNNN